MAATVLVTGATGFVGRFLVPELQAQGYTVRVAVRQPTQAPNGTDVYPITELSGDTPWASMLQGVDAVVHLAARVHVMQETATDPDAAFYMANVEGTASLAAAALAAGCKLFVNISSIKALGEGTIPGHPYTADSPLQPQDPYGRSKAAAESILQEISKESGMQAVSLRPPLIYGAGVGGNFRRLIALAHKKRPLPLGGIQNRRSLIYVENFTSAIMAVLSDGLSTPQVLKPAYVLSDAAPYSTTDMMANILRAMGMPDQDIAKKLWPCPTKAVRFVANLLGKGAMVDRILGDLEVDPTDFQRDLNWAPPYKIAESFTRTIQGNMR